MTIAEPTTKRKPLTKHQRAALFADHKGICVICNMSIDPRKAWVDEHIRALGLNGTNELKNRGPAHFVCAAVKTHDEDMPRINKAKAQAAMMVGKDPEAESSMQSRGFKHKAKRTDQLPMPPRRGMFQGTIE